MSGSLGSSQAQVAWTRRLLLAVLALAVSSPMAWASSTTSLSMIETPLQTLQTSIQGPVALAIGVIAMVLTGAVLIFGGELSDFAKRSSFVVLVMGVLLTANNVVHVLFTSATATIF